MANLLSNEFNVNGQRALVTGANSGIGAAIARALAGAGARVVINYLGEAVATEHLIKEIHAAGGEAIGIEADVTDEDQVRQMFEQTTTKLGGIDILVNNAGIRRDGSVRDLSLEDWEQVLRVNLNGPFLCSREAVRCFMSQPIDRERSAAAGKIICISSVHDRIGWVGHASYAASKGGVMRLMQTMAQELAPYRIRVNSIAPGAIRTGFNRAAWESPEAEASLLEHIPCGRIGQPEDVGRAAVWLASDASDYVTGATLYVDGGMTLCQGVREGG
jgi:glucose 1-dehydrogenase